jgi:hypothetical protein
MADPRLEPGQRVCAQRRRVHRCAHTLSATRSDLLPTRLAARPAHRRPRSPAGLTGPPEVPDVAGECLDAEPGRRCRARRSAGITHGVGLARQPDAAHAPTGSTPREGTHHFCRRLGVNVFTDGVTVRLSWRSWSVSPAGWRTYTASKHHAATGLPWWCPAVLAGERHQLRLA